METLVDDAIVCIMREIEYVCELSIFARINRRIYSIFIDQVNRIKMQQGTRAAKAQGFQLQLCYSQQLREVAQCIREACYVVRVEPKGVLQRIASRKCDICIVNYTSQIRSSAAVFKYQLVGITRNLIDTVIVSYLHVCWDCQNKLILH